MTDEPLPTAFSPTWNDGSWTSPLVVHMIAEYVRDNGQSDLLRERIDGDESNVGHRLRHNDMCRDTTGGGIDEAASAGDRAQGY